jgi:hypothetical protein
MNPLAITGLVVIALFLLSGAVLVIAWCYDRIMRRDRRPRTLQENIDALGRSNTVQIIITCLIGLAAGTIYFVGFCFERAGGWQ